MFSNFIYFIIALISLNLYQPPPTPPLTPIEALLGFFGLALLFSLQTRYRFRSLARRADLDTIRKLDQRFSKLLTQHSMLALAVFAADIWILDLPSYLQSIRLVVLLPTIKDMLFLMLFVGYLTVVWHYSYDAHNAIYKNDISRRTYVYSNFAFSVPILLPWALLFGISDLLSLLPFEGLKQILDSTAGQIVYFLIFLIVAAVFAPVLIQRFWHCRPLEPGMFRERIEALCRRAGVRHADIVYWPIFGGRMITAAVMGLVGRFRYILVTDALLRLLTPDEVDQVIAHEIGHVKRRHLLLYLMFLVGFMLIAALTEPLSGLIYLLLLDSGFDFFGNTSNQAMVFIYFSILVIGIVLYFRFIFGYFIRNFERQADLYVFDLFPSAQPLLSTFDKIIDSSNQPADKPNWHHFSVKERIDYLKKCENEPAWIKRHDRKIRISIAVFLVSFAALTPSVGYLQRMTKEIALQQVIPNLKREVVALIIEGDTELSNNNIPAAISAYEKAMSIAPDVPHVLNNLAMLLITADDHSLRDKVRALALARRAIQLEKTPYIWDTLAEALYANGRIEEAIAAEKEALAMNPEDREIYERQLERFEKRLKDTLQGKDAMPSL